MSCADSETWALWHRHGYFFHWLPMHCSLLPSCRAGCGSEMFMPCRGHKKTIVFSDLSLPEATAVMNSPTWWLKWIMWDSKNGNVLLLKNPDFLRITDWLMLEGTSGGHQVHPPAQPGPPRTSFPGPCPDTFWVSPRTEMDMSMSVLCWGAQSSITDAVSQVL